MTSCPKSTKQSLLRYPMCSHLETTEQKSRTDGHVTGLSHGVGPELMNGHLLPPLSSSTLAPSRLTVEDQKLFHMSMTLRTTCTIRIFSFPRSRLCLRRLSRHGQTAFKPSSFNTDEPKQRRLSSTQTRTTVFLMPLFPSTPLPSDRDRQSDTRVRLMAWPQHGFSLLFSPLHLPFRHYHRQRQVRETQKEKRKKRAAPPVYYRLFPCRPFLLV